MDTSRIPMYVVAAAVLAVALSVAGVPFTRLLPFAVILVCPLMMIFMMRGHGNHGGHSDSGHTDGTKAAGDDRHAHTTSSIEDLRRAREQHRREMEQREGRGKRQCSRGRAGTSKAT